MCSAPGEQHSKPRNFQATRGLTMLRQKTLQMRPLQSRDMNGATNATDSSSIPKLLQILTRSRTVASRWQALQTLRSILDQPDWSKYYQPGAASASWTAQRTSKANQRDVASQQVTDNDVPLSQQPGNFGGTLPSSSVAFPSAHLNSVRNNNSSNMIKNPSLEDVLVWQIQQCLTAPDPTLLPMALDCLALVVSESSHSSSHKTKTSGVKRQPSSSVIPSASSSAALLQCWKMYRYDPHILQPLLQCWRAWAKRQHHGQHRRNHPNAGTKSSSKSFDDGGDDYSNIWTSPVFLERLGLALTMEIVGNEVGSNHQHHDGDGDNHSTSIASLQETLWGLVKDITFRAHPAAQQVLFQEYGAIVLKTIQQLNKSKASAHSSVVVLDQAVATLWNWTVQPGLALQLARMPLVWTVLEDLHTFTVNRHNSSKSAARDVPSAVANKATAALGTLLSHCCSGAAAMSDNDDESKGGLPQAQTWIVPQLVSFLMTTMRDGSSDAMDTTNYYANAAFDVDWRRRALRTLRCLVSVDWGRRLLMMDDGTTAQANDENKKRQQQQVHSGTPITTSMVLILQSLDESSEARTHAGFVLAGLVGDATISNDYLQALVSGNSALESSLSLERIVMNLLADPQSPHELVPACIAVWKACLARHTECNNEHAQATKDGDLTVTLPPSSIPTSVYETLGKVLREHPDDEAYYEAASALMETLLDRFLTLDHFSSENKMIDDANSNNIDDSLATDFLSPRVLDIWTLCLTPVGPAFQASRSAGLRLVERSIINCCQRKKLLADHAQLLGALVQVCLVTSGTTKAYAKRLVLELVPEL